MHKNLEGKRTLTPKVKNDDGETITSRKGIANVFGEFYSNLFAKTQGDEVQQSQNMETRTSNEKESCSEDMEHQSSHKMTYKLPLINSRKGTASDKTGIQAEEKC